MIVVALLGAVFIVLSLLWACRVFMEDGDKGLTKVVPAVAVRPLNPSQCL